jgi:hypothetical protein
MSGEKGKHYNFSKDYKALPIKKRVSLIKIARVLLNLQKENKAVLADAGSCKKQERMSL